MLRTYNPCTQMHTHTHTNRLYTSLSQNLVNVELTEKCKNEYKNIIQYSELHDSLYVFNFVEIFLKYKTKFRIKTDYDCVRNLSQN